MLSANLLVAGTVNAPLSGEGLNPVANVAIAPASETFGTILIGQTSGATFTITNNGTAPAAPFSVAITGTNASQFSITGGTCASVASLAQGASCTAVVVFAPTTTGMLSANLLVAGTVNAPLSGEGLNPVANLAIAPANETFGTVLIGQTSGATFTISNSGTGAAAPFSVAITGTNASQFSITGGTCASVASLAQGASCTAVVVFAPTTTGMLSANLLVAGTVNAPLSGTGANPVAVVTIAPATESFGNVTLGKTATATLTVSNSGTAAAPFSTTITGTNAAAFTRTGGTCASLASLAAGASCTLTVQFAPTALGTATATLSVGSLASAALTGVGVSALTASPAQLSFGNLNVGQNTSNSVTITNTGTTAVAFSSSITGTNASEFTRTGGSCASLTSLAGGASCSVTIRFAPTATGAQTASLTIGSPTQITVPLTGTGL
jgi:hypothetical protein